MTQSKAGSPLYWVSVYPPDQRLFEPRSGPGTVEEAGSAGRTGSTHHCGSCRSERAN